MLIYLDKWKGVGGSGWTFHIWQETILTASKHPYWNVAVVVIIVHDVVMVATTAVRKKTGQRLRRCVWCSKQDAPGSWLHGVAFFHSSSIHVTSIGGLCGGGLLGLEAPTSTIREWKQRWKVWTSDRQLVILLSYTFWLFSASVVLSVCVCVWHLFEFIFISSCKECWHHTFDSLSLTSF